MPPSTQDRPPWASAGPRQGVCPAPGFAQWQVGQATFGQGELADSLLEELSGELARALELPSRSLREPWDSGTLTGAHIQASPLALVLLSTCLLQVLRLQTRGPAAFPPQVPG